MIDLKITTGKIHLSRSFKQEKVTIGRSVECDVVIEDKKLSRKHCVIEWKDGGYVVSDLHSVNGLFVNKIKTMECVLGVNDEIKLGDATILVASIKKPSAASPAPSSRAHDRNAVRQKIDDKRAVMRKVKTHAAVQQTVGTLKEYKAAVILIGGVVIVLTLLFFVNGPSRESTPDVSQSQASVAARQSSGDQQEITARIDALLSQFDKEVSSKEVTRNMLKKGGDLIDKAFELINALKDKTVRSSYESAAMDRENGALSRYYDLIEEQEGEVNAKVADSLKRRNYGEAIQVARAFKESVDDPLAKLNVEHQVAEINKSADKDFDRLNNNVALLKGAKKYQDAKTILIKEQGRFKETPHHATIYAMAIACDELAKADKPLPPTKEEVARETARKQIEDRNKKLEPLIASATQLVNAGKFLEAETAYTKLLDAVKDAPELAKQYRDKYEELKKYNTLFRRLIAEINAGKLGDNQVHYNGTTTGSPSKADDKGITFVAAGNSELALWTSIPPKIMYAMVSSLTLSDDELYTLAVFCEMNKMTLEACSTIAKYIGSDKAEKQKKGFELIAKVKGESQPAGGYVYDSAKKEYLSAREKKEGDALAAATKAIKSMEKAESATSFGKLFDTVYNDYYNSPDISDATKSTIKQMTLAMLEKHRQTALEKLKKSAGSGKTGSFSQLKELKLKLNKARDDAMAVIFDLSIYPEANHGRSGQPKVDAAVKVVEDIWKDAGKVVVQNDPKLMDGITAIRKINDEYLQKLGEAPKGDDLKEMEDIVNNIGKSIDIRSFALTKEERDLIEYNNAVDAFNKKIAGIPDDIKEQVNVTNDYREMMGLKRLMIEPRLCKAAQKHTDAQAKAGSIWHVGSDGNPQGRCQAEGFSGYTGENVALGFPSPEAVHRGWYNSSGHHRNILGKRHTHMGAGHVGKFWTQDFGRSSATP